jgi:AcrR family transcriptional regulator
MSTAKRSTSRREAVPRAGGAPLVHAQKPARVPEMRPGKEGGVRAENRKKRTGELVRASLGLFLVHGLEAVTIDDITRQAGVAKGSFYRYFEDKAALVRVLFDDIAHQVESAFSSCDAALRQAETPEAMNAAYVALGLQLVQVVTEHSEVLRLYLQECRGPDDGARRPVASLARAIRDGAIVLTEAARTHGMLKDIDARISALAVIGAIERLLYGHLSGEDVGPPEDVPGALISLVLDGLRAAG